MQISFDVLRGSPTMLILMSGTAAPPTVRTASETVTLRPARVDDRFFAAAIFPMAPAHRANAWAAWIADPDPTADVAMHLEVDGQSRHALVKGHTPQPAPMPTPARRARRTRRNAK